MSDHSNALEHAAKVEDKVATMRDRTVELAGAAIPKVAETARQAGSSVANFATAAGETLVAALNSEKLANLATMGLSIGAARITGRQVLRFAMRRPVLVIVGGIAATRLGMAIYRRMQDNAA
jgi:hypothetical protein